MEIIVTRAGQITLSKEIRDALGITVGTPLEVNRVGSTILIGKKDASYWDTAGKILPTDFESTLRKLRREADVRLKEQGTMKVFLDTSALVEADKRKPKSLELIASHSDMLITKNTKHFDYDFLHGRVFTPEAALEIVRSKKPPGL